MEQQAVGYQGTISGLLSSATGLSTLASEAVVSGIGALWNIGGKQLTQAQLNEITSSLYETALGKITEYLEARFSEDLRAQSRSIADSLVNMTVKAGVGYTTSLLANCFLPESDEDDTLRSRVNNVLTLAWAVPLALAGGKCLYDAYRIRQRISSLKNAVDAQIDYILDDLTPKTLPKSVRNTIIHEMAKPLKTQAHQLIAQRFNR
ncbi:MAG: hypothetical protein K940chlam8_00574 [Chlamydiae bacterium]|nr:hypothetical protein [Chlamydiota bacterium]